MKFRIGDKVKIINTGKQYTEYSDWASKYKLTNWRDLNLNKGAIGKIIALGPHLNLESETICAIELNNGISYLIGQTGLELVKPATIKSEYPKEMYVWDNRGYHKKIKREVLGFYQELPKPYLVQGEVSEEYFGYDYAEDIPQGTELTIQEIADKFNINVEQLKIKK